VLWEESLELGRKLGDSERVMAVLLNLGYTTTVRGDLERAEALLEEELAMSRESKDPHASSMALIGLGIVETRRGEHGRAKTLLGEALVLIRKLGSMGNFAEGLETLAEMAAALGDFPRAARLWGAANTLREVTGSPWMPLERRLHEPHLVAAWARLDEADWTRAWEEGRAMPQENVITYALEDAKKLG
jgi:tetratricopeptide (TPR) repeat protein